MKAPKKYECRNCGFISDKHKSVDHGWVSFAVCYKCRGRVRERLEWLNWLRTEQRKIFSE